MNDLCEIIALSRIKGLSLFKKREILESKDSVALKDAIKDFKGFKEIEKELKRLDDMNIEVLTINDKEYPVLLKNIPDAPIVIYKKGRVPEGTKYISIVGSRKATYAGINISEKIAQTLSSIGITIVSGLARGIDAAAHRGALNEYGKTVAVLGSGIDICYPSENYYLYERIGREGAIISEYGLGERPYPFRFPERNRIIAGMSRGIVVVEASAKSGSLITARLGLEYGREVMAIPGSIFNEEHRGANRLIKNGARLIEGIEDIITNCFPDLYHLNVSSENKVDMDEEESYIYNLIGNDKTHIDEIIEKSKRHAKEVMAIITRLEIKEIIRQFPGGYYIRR